MLLGVAGNLQGAGAIGDSVDACSVGRGNEQARPIVDLLIPVLDLVKSTNSLALWASIGRAHGSSGEVGHLSPRSRAT